MEARIVNLHFIHEIIMRYFEKKKEDNLKFIVEYFCIIDI